MRVVSGGGGYRVPMLRDVRRMARTGPAGDLVTLEEQDRTIWDRAQIDEGVAVERRYLERRLAEVSAARREIEGS